MKNVLPAYQRPIYSISDPIINVDEWEKATDAFDEKNYKQSIIHVINYVNPKLLENIDLTGNIKISQMQGSAEINIEISENGFSVQAPFLKMTDKTNKVALKRKIAEVNFHPLTLAQIRQINHDFWFEFETELVLCNPHKIYDVLKEVCVLADDYDDLFIEKYKAEFYKTPKVTALSEEELVQVWNQISKVFEDYQNYFQLFTEKRWENFKWDIIMISLLKLSNMAYLNGKLRSDLIEYVNLMLDQNMEFKMRVDKGINFMNQLVKKSKEEILKNVYHAEQLQSNRWRSSEKIISERLENCKEQVDSYMTSDSFFNLSYYLQYTFLKLIYDYNLNEDYRNAIHTALENAAGLSPEIGYKTLVDTFSDLLNATVKKPLLKNEDVVTKKVKKGFFAKLFS